jgi:hypothetical protein
LLAWVSAAPHTDFDFAPASPIRRYRSGVTDPVHRDDGRNANGQRENRDDHPPNHPALFRGASTTSATEK